MHCVFNIAMYYTEKMCAIQIEYKLLLNVPCTLPNDYACSKVECTCIAMSYTESKPL